MISQCANPACAKPFHYLRGGRLYRYDIRSPEFPCNDVHNSICSLKPSRATVFFWLCEQCVQHYSLQFSCQGGATLVERPQSAPALTTAPVITMADTGGQDHVQR